MRSLLQFTTAVVVIFIIGTCIISDTRFAAVLVAADDFIFPDRYYCSPLAIEDYEPDLRKAREKILVDVVHRHYSPEHRGEHNTCLKRTVGGSIMWAQADCRVPDSDFCIGCLVYATNYLDKNCLYFSGGRVSEKTGLCTMKFGDYDVCASIIATRL